MRVRELWRYPVKSLQGERLDSVRVGSDGLEGDRRFALYDAASGLGLTARRAPELLFASARLLDGVGVEITLLAGVTQAELDEVARWLNDRPRQTLGFRTPAEKLTDLVDTLLTGAPER